MTDGRTLVHYFRTTRDGRILLGWGGGRLAYGVARERPRGGRRRGGARDARGAGAALPRRSRGGASRTPGAARSTSPPATSPRSGRCRASRSTSASASPGNGVGPTNLVGRTLASLATGADDELTRLPLVGADAGAWVPPEPLTWLGGSIVRGALVRRERIQEDGRDARPADARRVRRAAGDRACIWRGRLARVSASSRVASPAVARCRGARRPGAARPVRRVGLPGADRGAHAEGRAPPTGS